MKFRMKLTDADVINNTLDGLKSVSPSEYNMAIDMIEKTFIDKKCVTLEFDTFNGVISVVKSK